MITNDHIREEIARLNNQIQKIEEQVVALEAKSAALIEEAEAWHDLLEKREGLAQVKLPMSDGDASKSDPGPPHLGDVMDRVLSSLSIAVPPEEFRRLVESRFRKGIDGRAFNMALQNKLRAGLYERKATGEVYMKR